MDTQTHAQWAARSGVHITHPLETSIWYQIEDSYISDFSPGKSNKGRQTHSTAHSQTQPGSAQEIE